MTDRIYYSDPYCRSFEATVIRCFDHGGRHALMLDRTAFYPTSGGQPFDTGRLNTSDVIETIDADGVVHIVSSPLAEGTRVAGEIDWTRRFDHMQQHTGQHLLSAAFDRLFENPTVSFHIGAEVSTIDLEREASASEIERAVDTANAIVWEDRPISIRFVSQEEAARLALRKDPVREGPLRLIEIDGFDLCACGGTHVDRTGAVGVTAVLGWERQRRGTRVTFVCGSRAVRALRGYRDAIAGSVRVLSVIPGELPAAVERVQAESRDALKQIKELKTKLAGYEGARLVAEAADVASVRLVIHTVAGSDPGELKALAAAAIAAGRAAVVLMSSAAPLSVVVARSEGVPLDANGLLRQLIDRFGGRGGGKPDLAQGGGLDAPAHEIASAARTLIESALRT